MAPTARHCHSSRKSRTTWRGSRLPPCRGTPWPDDFSFRVLANRLTELWADREAEAAAAFGSLAAAYADARNRQDIDMVVTVAGECVGLIHDRPTVGVIINAMVTDAQAARRRGATLTDHKPGS
jgi:nitronate monooxygenase